MWTSGLPFRSKSRVLSQALPDAMKGLLLALGAVEQPRSIGQIQFGILPPAFVRLSEQFRQTTLVWTMEVGQLWQELQ